MKKTIKSLILILTLAFCQGAFCYTLSGSELNKIIYNQINSEVKKELGNIEYKINIQGALTDIITNEVQAPKIEISKNEKFSPVSYRRVVIKDSKQNIVKTFPVNIQVFIYKNVLVANEAISYGEKIDGTNTKLEKREVSKYYDKVLSEIPNDIVSSRNITKDSVIQKSFLKQKALIEKNQNIDIVFQGKGVQIMLRGKALKEGALGDVILVRSDKYNKTYSATVDSNSKVTVRI